MSETIDLAALAAATVADGDSLLALNGNTVKSVKIGGSSGNVCKLSEFPKFSELVSQGYLDEANKNNAKYYIEALFKYLAAKHPKGGLFFGTAVHGSTGIVIIHTYNGLADNGSRLPSYGTAFYTSLSQSFMMAVYNGVYTCRMIDSTLV